MQTNVEKMNFFNEIKKDKALYADMLESLRQEDAEILREIGAWLEVNGEAIYESCPIRKRL